MKVRIINTKENPVIIKSDKKPPFVDRPSFANGSLLFAPYKQGYTTPDALYKLLDDIKQDGKSYLDEIDVFGDNLDYLVWIYTSDFRYTPEFVDEVYFKLDPFSKIYVESRGNFENSCVLGVRGVLRMSLQEGYLIKASSHYIILIRDDSGNFSDLYLDYERDNILFRLNNNQIYNICLVANKESSSIVLYIDGEKIVSFSDDFFNGSKRIYMPIQTDGIIAPCCISLNTKQTDIVDEDIQEVIKMLELSCIV